MAKRISKQNLYLNVFYERRYMHERTMINHDLTYAMNTWPKWQVNVPKQPTYVRELTSGKTNNSHVVCIADTSYVIRLNTKTELTLAVNRFHEQLIVAKLSPLGICPKIVYPSVADSVDEQAITVFEYVDGQVWDAEDFAEAKNQNRLLNVIELYKHVNVDLPHFDYVDCVLRYWKAIEQRGIRVDPLVAIKFQKFTHDLEIFSHNLYQPVLSHHDLVADNILETKKGLMIIDWEYAGMGHPDFDRVYIKKCMSSTNGMTISHVDLSEIEFKSPIEQIIDWLNILWLMLR